MNLDLRKKIVKNIYKIARWEMLKFITGNIGDIIEEDDKFICKVSQKKLDKMYKKDRDLTLNLSGVNPDSEYYTSYKLDKPIYYVFDNINFLNTLKFFSPFNSNVIFRECNFRKNIDILWASGEVKFERNSFCNQSSYEYDKSLFKSKYDRKTEIYEMLYGRRINKIVFEGNFRNLKSGAHPGHYGIDIQANDVKIMDSIVEIKKPGVCFIRANNLKFDNACIKCNELYIDSKNIYSCDSSIVAKNVIIDNENKDLINNIYANTIVYNNILLKDDNLLDGNHDVVLSEVVVNVDENLVEKQNLRMELINRLKSLQKKCEEIKQEELGQKEQELNNKEVSKILRK
ncbi:MAG: hypothetical protein IJ068_04255 [Bacilli bacterium]|nr:hypothetical protein [Bacilli bacterium]